MIDGGHEIFVLWQIVRRSGHPTREFGHKLGTIPIRERVAFLEQLLCGLRHEIRVPRCVRRVTFVGAPEAISTLALQPRAIMRQRPDGCKRLGGESERKIERMTNPAEAVLADALRLDLDARAEVAVELLASLDGPADPDAEAAWAMEIERRVATIEAGTAKLEPWDDVKRRIEKESLGR